MTSIPASRSARAMTFAPRSWPSSPGLAMRTRIFFIGGATNSAFSSNCDLFVGAKSVAHGVADFAEGGVGFDCVVDEGHQIIFAFGRGAKRGEAACDFVARTLGAKFLQSLGLTMREGFVNLQNLEWFFFGNKRVHADHEFFFVVEFTLIAIGSFRNFALREAALDGGDHAAERVNLLDVIPGAFFDFIG